MCRISRPLCAYLLSNSRPSGYAVPGVSKLSNRGTEYSNRGVKKTDARLKYWHQTSKYLALGSNIEVSLWNFADFTPVCEIDEAYFQAPAPNSLVSCVGRPCCHLGNCLTPYIYDFLKVPHGNHMPTCHLLALASKMFTLFLITGTKVRRPHTHPYSRTNFLNLSLSSLGQMEVSHHNIKLLGWLYFEIICWQKTDPHARSHTWKHN